MNRHVKTLLLGSAVLMAGVLPSHAQGNMPPPPPTGFTVTVTSGTAIAHWNPMPANDVVFSLGQYNVSAPESQGTTTLHAPVVPQRPYTFTLVASNWAGVSSPVQYIYVPVVVLPPNVNVPYRFVNASSTGSVVQGYITFNPYNAPQKYVTASLGPNSTFNSTVPLQASIEDLIYAKGFITVGGGITCGPLNVQTPNLLWPPYSTVVVTYTNAGNPSKFSCTLTLQ